MLSLLERIGNSIEDTFYLIDSEIKYRMYVPKERRKAAATPSTPITPVQQPTPVQFVQPVVDNDGIIIPEDKEYVDKDIMTSIVEYKELYKKVDNLLNVNFTTVADPQDVKLKGDELDNLLEDITEKTIEKSELSLDDEDSRKHMLLIALVTLLAGNKIDLANLFSYLKNRDEVVEVNTIYKFFTGTKLVAEESVVQLNEFVTAQLLYDEVSVITEMNDWGMEANFSEMLEKVSRRLEYEIASNGKITGEESVDPIVPLTFNQGVLNTAFDVKIPKFKTTTEEYIKQHILSILPENWKNDNEAELELHHYLDQTDNNRDTGKAVLTLKIHGIQTNEFEIDLDSIAGNGYSIACGAFVDYNIGITKVYVNIEKFPKVVAEIIMSNGRYLLNNPADPKSIMQYKEIMQDTFSMNIILNYDLSGMSKHFAFMTNAEKARFANNLMSICYANWNDTPDKRMYRMRVRKFDSPDKFTLVSDNKTRQQEPGFLSVIGNKYKTYFKEEQKEGDDPILVVKYKEGKLSVAYNGANIKMYIPSEVTEYYRNMEEKNGNGDVKPINPVLNTDGSIKSEFTTTN